MPEDSGIAAALKENPIDQNATVPIMDKLPMEQYKLARGRGEETIEEAIEPTPKVTGEESLKDYKSKRAEQQGRDGNSGLQKAIGRLTKQKYQALETAKRFRDRLSKHEPVEDLDLTPTERRRLEAGHASETVEASAFRQVAERKAAANGNEPEDPIIPAMRQRYPNWDAEMTRAKNENMRISDEAAKVMHSSQNRGHIIRLLVTDDEFRTEFNKLPPKQQVEEMEKLDGHIGIIESGGGKFKESVESSLSPSELAEVKKAITTNRTGAAIVISLMKEINALPNGPAVFKSLITDQRTSERLAGMSQSAASMELGRMSARLEGGNGKIESRAPAPIKPVGTGSTASSVPLGEMSMDAYKRARRAGRVR